VDADPRRTPDEAAVRDQLREEEELVPEPPPGSADTDAQVPGTQARAAPVDADVDGERKAAESDATPESSEPAAEADATPEPSEPAAEANAVPEPSEPDPEEEPLERAERERGEYLALAQRTRADFDNYRKRAAREAAAAGERAKTGLVRELLPAVDNLERALASAQGGEDELAGGVALVHTELIGVLARNGVEPFDPAGERFDPAQHEALSTRPDGESEAGIVLDVVERGYRLNGTVLRPARVVVSG
jgi:molecular chaperone GrpE